MVIVAIAEPQDDFIVPIPFDISPSNIKGDEKIIVAIDDIPPSKELISEVKKFYGYENCEFLIGKIPPEETEKTVICIPSHCILNIATAQEGKFPPKYISPLWTEDKFGISAEEAIIIQGSSQEMTSAIHVCMNEFRKVIEDLEIKIDIQSIKNIKECQELIQKAQIQLEEAKKDCRILSAEKVARFINHKFPVEAWADIIMEPAVFFCVSEKIDDDQAVVIGNSIEGVLNEIEPINADRFFNTIIPDATSFPIVMDVSFVNGKRITNRNDYLYAMQAEGHNLI